MFGLVSDGGVHSHNTHIYGLLELAKKNGLKKVYVHCFLDGRDTPPESGKGLCGAAGSKDEGGIGVGEVASVMGRYYAMDRDKRWDRVELAYNALTKGEKEIRLKALLQASRLLMTAARQMSSSSPFVVMKGRQSLRPPSRIRIP